MDLLLLLVPHSMFGELLDIQHKAVELPLPIELASSAQRESIATLVVSKVREHELDDREPRRARAGEYLAK
jgi:hypothetical protein